jgi:cobalt-zinc-cadmium efflux system protein
VVVAGGLIIVTQRHWPDPVANLVIVIVIVFSSWNLLRESLDLALDAVPDSIDPTSVQLYLQALPEVSSVHHLHIWAMSTTEVALTAQLVKLDARLDDVFLQRVHTELHNRFGIGRFGGLR